MIASFIETLTRAGKSFSKSAPSTKIALVLFYTICIHAAFVQPNFEIFPGVRAKIFTGLLCLFGISSLMFVPSWKQNLSRLEIILPIILGTLITISGLLSITPEESFFRGFVIFTSSLGGFYSARILLCDDDQKGFFVWFCLCCSSLS